VPAAAANIRQTDKNYPHFVVDDSTPDVAKLWAVRIRMFAAADDGLKGEM
jgi:hypothetical protein